MAVSWNDEERAIIESAIDRHPVESGRCAALARAVLKVANRRDEAACGKQVRPNSTSPKARWIIPKHPNVRAWGTHTFVETHQHAVDALTRADGCDASRYLEQHFEYVDALEIIDIDVSTVDPGIEDEP